ncbi:integrase [Litorimonas taeanensis]|uniref:Integrase n=1 Tax=Litorimonas taeanensis TaxID=568099 RepID=A0A420WDF7_9PROT|nr:site-specific integrase [Litorimonas taeanensis]RKQ68985.1 integrase [Litorimonas taeanensis]
MLKLDQRPSGIWRIRGTLHGVTVDKSARTRSRAEAEQIRKAWEREIFAQIYGFKDNSKNHTFADAAEAWVLSGGDTTAFYYFEKILTQLAQISLNDLTVGRIKREARVSFPTQSNATINRHFMGLVSVILNHAADEKMIPAVRMKRLPVKKTRIDWQPPSVIENLIDVAGDMAPLITFVVGTGARTNEVFRLDWKDVSPKGERVTLWRTKGNHPRSIDLCPRTRAALPERGIGFVWKRQDGQPWSEAPNGRFYGPARKLSRICKAHELPNIGIHSLRHSWASWQYAIDKDPIALMGRGGWTSLKMVLNYAHLATDDLAQQVEEYGWFSNQTGQNLGKIQDHAI